MANTIPGKAKNISAILINTTSLIPPYIPQYSPIVVPTIVIININAIVEKILLFPPTSTLENTSLPYLSVPKKCAKDGDWSALFKS